MKVRVYEGTNYREGGHFSCRVCLDQHACTIMRTPIGGRVLHTYMWECGDSECSYTFMQPKRWIPAPMPLEDGTLYPEHAGEMAELVARLVGRHALRVPVWAEALAPPPDRSFLPPQNPR